MPNLTAGQSATIDIPAGMPCYVSTTQDAYVDLVAGAPGSGYTSDRLVGGRAGKLYGPWTTPAKITIRSALGTATYGGAYAADPIDLGQKSAAAIVAINAAIAAGTASYPAASTVVNTDTGARWTLSGLGTAAAFAVDGAGIASTTANSTAAAAANVTAIQAALDSGRPAVVGGDEGVIIWLNDTLVYDSGMRLTILPGVTLKMVTGVRKPLMRSAAYDRMTTVPVSVTLTWVSGMTFTVAWASHGKTVGDAVWIDGGTLQAQYKGVFVVETVTDAYNFVVRAKRLPTGVPTGAVFAVEATSDVVIDGGRWDYNYDGTSAATGLHRMGFLNFGTYRVFLKNRTVNNCAKYIDLWCAHGHCGFTNLHSDGTNSDAVKVYGPGYGFRGESLTGILHDDGCSYQTREPSAYIAYQPYYGDVLDCEVRSIDVFSTTSQAVFYPGTLATGYMDNCRFIDIRGVSGTGVRAVNNMNRVDAEALDYSAGYLWFDGLSGDYVTPMQFGGMQLQKMMCRDFRASVSRVDPKEQVIVGTTFYAREMVFDHGLFVSAAITSIGGHCIVYGGGADLLRVSASAKTNGGNQRIIVLSSTSTVKTLVLDNVNSDCDQVVENSATNDPTIIVRDSRIGTNALLSARANCTLVLEGNDITNANNGVIRGNATCTVNLRTNGGNRLRAGSWAVQVAGTLTVNAYGWDIALDPISATWLGTTAGQYLSSTQTGAEGGLSVRTAGGWVAIGAGASQVNTLIA